MGSVWGFETKVDGLRKIYREKGKSSIVLEKQHNISWLAKGRTNITLGDLNGVASVVINDGGVYLVTNNSEARRMMEEEFSHVSGVMKAYEFNWADPAGRANALKELAGPGGMVTDEQCENEIRPIRMVFSKEELDELSLLCREEGEIFTKVLFSIKKGMTEHQIAGKLAKGAYSCGAQPMIILVAADERLELRRHPLPTGKSVEKTVMLVMGMRRNGLYSCLSRTLTFGKPDEELVKKKNSVLLLDAKLQHATRPGKNMKDIFHSLMGWYEQEGYPDAWKEFHQGGPAGYVTREYKATPDIDLTIAENMVFIWNPSVSGYKAEEVFLVGKDANQMLSYTPHLPQITFDIEGEKIARTDLLVR